MDGQASLGINLFGSPSGRGKNPETTRSVRGLRTPYGFGLGNTLGAREHDGDDSERDGEEDGGNEYEDDLKSRSLARPIGVGGDNQSAIPDGKGPSRVTGGPP